MAIARVGSTLVAVDWGSGGTGSVTVPADANCCLIFVTSPGTTGISVSRLNFRDADGSDFSTVLLRNTVSSTAGAYVLTSSSANFPASGNRTLSWSTSDNFGGHITVLFYSGVDTSSPIVDSDYLEGTQFSDTSFSFPAMTGISAARMTVAALGVYYIDSASGAVNSQTEIYSVTGWSGLIVAEKLNDDVMEGTVGPDKYRGHAGICLILRDAVTGGSMPVHLIARNPMAQLMGR